jgi:hypothetical protein
MDEKDREEALAKMRVIERAAVQRGVDVVVLGAWRCGAYGNPVGEIAEAWMRVLAGRNREGWSGVSEVVFAIPTKNPNGMKHFEEFKRIFDEVAEVVQAEEKEGKEEPPEDYRMEIRELKDTIKVKESEMAMIRSDILKHRVRDIIVGLKELDQKMRDSSEKIDVDSVWS